MRAVSGQTCRHLRGIGVRSASTIVHGAGIGGLEPRSSASAVTEGAVMGLYRFDKYKSGDEDKSDLDELVILDIDGTRAAHLKEGVEEGLILADAANLCRDMVNEPPNVMTPTRMAEVALVVGVAAG